MSTHTTQPTASGAQPGQSRTFYILKGRDCFGDVWPMMPTAGIDGREFVDQDEAISYLQQRKLSPEGRREMRLSAGWEKGTIKAFEVHEVTIS